MINVLLAASLLCQDPEVSARVRKADGEYEMTIVGKGPGLVEDSAVSLKFHRRVNRIDWNRGRIETVAAEDAGAARAWVEDGKFVHAQKFARPGEIEVRIGLQREDWHADRGGCPFRQIVRVFRVATASEITGSLRAASRKMDATLEGAREILDDAEALIDDPCLTARRERDLRKRLDWRLANYRKEVGESALSASAEAFVTLLSDVQREVEAGRGGKQSPERVSALTGEPFSWEQARHWLEEIETLALMERGLLMMREFDTLRSEIAAAAATGERWNRAESGFRRALEGLREIDRETRSGRLGDRFAHLSQGSEFTMPQMLDQMEGYLQAAAAAATCPESGQGDFEKRAPLIQEMVSSLEDHFRTLK